MNTLVGAAMVAAAFNFLYVLIAILVIIVLIVFLSFVPVGLWISASASGVKIGLFDLIGMRIRKVSAADIVNPMIKATKAGLDIPMNKLEAHYLAKGGKVNGKASVNRVVDSLIAAQRARTRCSECRANERQSQGHRNADHCGGCYGRY